MWYLLAAALWLLFLIGWYGVYAHAMQPRQGTLEWIGMYDRQPFTWLDRRQRLSRQDLWWLLGIVLITLALRLWLLSRMQPLGSLGSRTLITAAVMPALAGVGVYSLARLLGSRSLIAGLCAAAAAVCLNLDPAAGPVAAALTLFYLWMSQPAEVGFWWDALWLTATALCMGMAVVLAPACWWLMALLALLWLATMVLRWRQGFGWGKIALRALVCLLLCAGMLLGFLVFWAVQPQGLAWADLPRALWNGALLDTLRHLKSQLLGQLLIRPGMALLRQLQPSAALILAGLFAWFALIIRGLRRRSAQAAVLAVATAAVLVQYAVSGVYVLPVILLVDAAFVATDLWQREQKAIAVLLPALMLVLEIGTQLFFW